MQVLQWKRKAGQSERKETCLCRQTQRDTRPRAKDLPESLLKDQALPTARLIQGDLFGTFRLPELKGQGSVLSAQPLSLWGHG